MQKNEKSKYTKNYLFWRRKQARKLQATLVRNYVPPTHRLTGVRCRATSVAKNEKKMVYITCARCNHCNFHVIGIIFTVVIATIIDTIFAFSTTNSVNNGQTLQYGKIANEDSRHFKDVSYFWEDKSGVQRNGNNF